MPNETLNIQNGVSPITIDTEVTEGSMRPVTADGIFKAIQAEGDSSPVLDVVCTVTETGGVASYDYSVSAEDAVAAVNAGKAIRLTVSAHGYFSDVSGEYDCDYSTVNTYNTGGITFLIASGEARVMPAAIVRTYVLVVQVPEWREENNDGARFVLIGSTNTEEDYSVPQLTTDGSLQLRSIQETIDLDGSVAQLVLGAVSNAGVAVGTTITDPGVLAVLSTLQDMIVRRVVCGKPCKLVDGFGNTTYGWDVVSTAHEEGISGDLRLISMAATTSLIVAGGNLCDVTLSFGFTYGNVDNNQITQAQIAAYCDSHAITFM